MSRLEFEPVTAGLSIHGPYSALGYYDDSFRAAFNFWQYTANILLLTITISGLTKPCLPDHLLYKRN